MEYNTNSEEWRNVMWNALDTMDTLRAFVENYGAAAATGKYNILGIMESSRTILHMAVERRADTEMLKYLVKNGANVDAQDVYSMTPLAKAVWEDSLEIVECLLSCGADPNIGSASGMTPLARYLNHPRERIDLKMVGLLVAFGTNINTKCPHLDKTCTELADDHNIDLSEMVVSYPDVKIADL